MLRQPILFSPGPCVSCFTDRILDPDSLVAPLLRAPTKVVVLKRAVWVPPAPPLPPDEAAEVEKKRKLREEVARANAATNGVVRAKTKPQPGHRKLETLSDIVVELLYRQVRWDADRCPPMAPIVPLVVGVLGCNQGWRDTRRL